MTHVDQLKLPVFSLTKAGRQGAEIYIAAMGGRGTNKYKNKDKNARDIKASEQENTSGINRCYLYTFCCIIR